MRNSMKRELYSIAGTDLESKALAIYTISRVMIKYGGVAHRAKSPKKLGGMKIEQH